MQLVGMVQLESSGLDMVKRDQCVRKEIVDVVRWESLRVVWRLSVGVTYFSSSHRIIS